MEIQEIARNTFTVSALLLTASIVIINYSWKRLNNLIKTMPENKRRIVLNTKLVPYPMERRKYSYISIQFFSCVFLIIAVAGALVAVVYMSDIMVGVPRGVHTFENFEFAVVAMRVSAWSLFMGVFFSAAVYLEDLFALYTGQQSIATTELLKLRPLPPKDEAWSNILAGILLGFPIILLIIELFIPLSQWLKILIALILGIILLAGSRFVYRLCVQTKHRRFSQ